MSAVFVTILEVIFIIAITAGTGFDPAGNTAYVLYMRINGLGAITVIFLMCLVSVAIIAFFKVKGQEVHISRWKTFVAPLLGLIGLIFLLVLSAGEADMLIGASKSVSMALTIIIPIVFIAGFLYAKRLKVRKNDVYMKIGRQ